MVAVTLLLASAAHAAAPGITGPTFSLDRAAGFHQPARRELVYSWGYGCVTGPAASAFAPAMAHATAELQHHAGTRAHTDRHGAYTGTTTVTVTLTNNLPAAAGNTSILFPGFQVTATRRRNRAADAGGGARRYSDLHTYDSQHCGRNSLLLQRNARRSAGRDGPVRGTSSCSRIPPTYRRSARLACPPRIPAPTPMRRTRGVKIDFRLAAAAYNHPGACYDREYLFQFSEMDPRIHREAEEQSTQDAARVA